MAPRPFQTEAVNGALTQIRYSGQPQHVIGRGNDCTNIFCAEADHQCYLERLQLACDKHACKLHAYVPMTMGTFRGLEKNQWGQTRLIRTRQCV